VKELFMEDEYFLEQKSSIIQTF